MRSPFIFWDLLRFNDLITAIIAAMILAILIVVKLQSQKHYPNFSATTAWKIPYRTVLAISICKNSFLHPLALFSSVLRGNAVDLVKLNSVFSKQNVVNFPLFGRWDIFFTKIHCKNKQAEGLPFNNCLYLLHPNTITLC
jgi:hypothetical protein